MIAFFALCAVAAATTGEAQSERAIAKSFEDTLLARIDRLSLGRVFRYRPGTAYAGQWALRGCAFDSVRFDISRTNSIVTPYQASVTGRVKTLFSSPAADSIIAVSRVLPTIAAESKAISAIPFTLIYNYQDGWILADGRYKLLATNPNSQWAMFGSADWRALWQESEKDRLWSSLYEPCLPERLWRSL